MAGLELTPNAVKVLKARYLRRDAQRQIIEKPEELFARVARAVSQAELLFGGPRLAAYWEDKFGALLTSLDFLPNSPTLMNAGNPLGQLSACFVLPVTDSMEGIFEALKQMALVQRTGGGTGFSFSGLRPQGALVQTTSGEASGPVSFMRIFDCATENIKQGGRRRGANMGVLRVDHPDIRAFIDAKGDGAGLRNFNISVGVTDAFMDAAEEGEDYGLIDPASGERVRSLSATEVFDALVASAWRTGDPGILFLDAINRENPTPRLGSIEATNPCGEVPLLPYEPCNLGSINLAHMLTEDGGGAAINREKLRETTSIAVRFLDDAIEMSRYPIPRIERMSRSNRKIGLGVMGFAEMLVRLGVSYDSDKAVTLGADVMQAISQEALNTSWRLAEERGVFPNWSGSAYEAKGIRVRNATRTAIAPTGTIGIIAGTSPGIEPFFALAYKREGVLGGQSLVETNPLLIRHLKRHGLDPDPILAQIRREGSLAEVAALPDEIKRLFVTALEISPERHLQIQQAFQQHVENSVSKTINMPAEASASDVGRIYREAWEMGMKGVTIYRYGSKPTQVMTLGLGEEPYQFDHGARCDPGECNF